MSVRDEGGTHYYGDDCPGGHGVVAERIEVRKFGHNVPLAEGPCFNCGRLVRFNLAAGIAGHVDDGQPNDCREPWPAANIEAAQIDGEASDSDGVSATTNEASVGADGNRGARVDGSGATVATAETAISDEECRALAFAVARALPRIVSRNAEGVQVFDAPMLAQCLREAGYRREVDVLRECDRLDSLADERIAATEKDPGSPIRWQAKGVKLATKNIRRALATAQAQPLPVSVGTPTCTCPLIDVSSTPGKPEFLLGDPTGCEVHGQGRVQRAPDWPTAPDDGLVKVGQWPTIADAGTAEFDRLWAELENAPPPPPASDETREHPGQTRADNAGEARCKCPKFCRCHHHHTGAANAGTFVVATKMDPAYTPPSASLNPAAHNAGAAGEVSRG